MGRVLTLQREDGLYQQYIEIDPEEQREIITHFVVDCACGVKSGSVPKNHNGGLADFLETYQPSRPDIQPGHTIYLPGEFLYQFLKENHKRNPLILVCRNPKCLREFSFTHKSYKILTKEIYNSNLKEGPLHNLTQ